VNSSHNTPQEFEALFNNAAIGIITINKEGQIVLANKFAIQQFGYSNESELLGNKIEMLIPKRYDHRHVGHRTNYYKHNTQSRPMGVGLDLFAIKKDGTEFPVEVSLSSYHTEGQQYAIAFVNDISIRKNSEEALVKLNTQLEELVVERTQTLSDTVNQLEIQIKEAKEKDIQLREALEREKELGELKSKFVSLASHEFRTPLTTILSSAYLVSQYKSDDEQQPKRERHIEKIVSSVNMLDDILNDFLSVGKIEEGKIKVRIAEFNLADHISALINQMNSNLKKDQKIVLSYKGNPVVEFLDQNLIKHILMNLLSNAIKFSPENSSIQLSVSHLNTQLILSVKDEGLGIPEEDLEHLSERFFRASNVNAIQGTGLGLHIVSKYAELLNGTIKCKSQVGKGTEFIVTFDSKISSNANNTGN